MWGRAAIVCRPAAASSVFCASTLYVSNLAGILYVRIRPEELLHDAERDS